LADRRPTTPSIPRRGEEEGEGGGGRTVVKWLACDQPMDDGIYDVSPHHPQEQQQQQ